METFLNPNRSFGQATFELEFRFHRRSVRGLCKLQDQGQTKQAKNHFRGAEFISAKYL